METAKKKITVRFVVEQDFEVEVRDSDLGMGSFYAIGDVMCLVALTNGIC